MCQSYNCQEVTSYHGGECQIDPSCIVSTQSETVEVIDPASVSSCSPLGVCNQFGCAETACNEYGCPASPQYYKLDTSCSEDYYCTSLNCAGGANNINEPDLRCFLEDVPNGNPFVINITESGTSVLTNSYYQCNPTSAFEEGDPWCDYSASSDPVAYNYVKDRCETVTPAVCDMSAISGGVIQSYTQNGCDVLNATGSDYWGQYNNNCVRDPIVTNVYSQACCFAYSIDDFEVYDDALSKDNVENGIRVY